MSRRTAAVLLVLCAAGAAAGWAFTARATTENLPAFASTEDFGYFRCDSSQGGGKDCYFWLQLANYQQTIDYQAYKGAIRLVIDEITDDDWDDNRIIIEMCITQGPGMSDNPIYCTTLANTWVWPGNAGFVFNLGGEAGLGAFAEEANWASFHIVVKELYTHSSFSVWGRRPHIDSLEANVQGDGTYDICWETTNVPNGDYAVLKGPSGEVVSQGGPIDRCVNVTPSATPTTYALEATGPGQEGPGLFPPDNPATAIESVTVPEGGGNRHLECVDNTCTVVPGQGNDGCFPEGSACGSTGRYKCQGQSCVFDANDSGPDQCADDADCTQPTHFECVGQSCQEVSGGGRDDCSSNADCVPVSHTECRNNSCVSVSGAGPNRCANNNDCIPGPDHRECRNNSCTVVPGPGSDQCVTNTDCRPQTHRACENYTCVVKSGAGPNECSVEQDCWPPPPECPGGLTASPDRIVIPPRRNVSLNWSCSVTQGSCSISPAPGSVNHSGPATVTPTETTTYMLTCSDRWGRSTSDDALVRVLNYVGGRLKEIKPQ